MGKVSGFTLIEILVSLMLLSIMLLGLDALNLTSLRTAKTIWQYHITQLEEENSIEQSKAKIETNESQPRLYVG